MSVKTTSPRNDQDRTPARLALERFLPYRLNMLAEAVSGSLSRHYAERYGISVPEWRVLATLGQYERMTATAIGSHSRMHKTKVSRAIAMLEAKGYVARQRSREDMRAAFVTLLPAGRQVYCALVPEALGFERDLLAALTAEERRGLMVVIDALEARAATLAEQGPVRGNGQGEEA